MNGFVRLICTKCGAKQNRALPYSMATPDFCSECGKPIADPLPLRPPARIQSQATLIAMLVEALAPFAQGAERIRADDPDNDRPAFATVSDFRTARKAHEAATKGSSDD